MGSAASTQNYLSPALTVAWRRIIFAEGREDCKKPKCHFLPAQLAAWPQLPEPTPPQLSGETSLTMSLSRDGPLTPLDSTSLDCITTTVCTRMRTLRRLLRDAPGIS